MPLFILISGCFSKVKCDYKAFDKGRLLTALRVICFIGHFSDDRNGEILSFKGGSLMLPYSDIARLEQFVRTAE